jgi:hypothetical protein
MVAAGRLALGAGGVSLAVLACVLVPFAFFAPFEGSERLAQIHALLWLGFFSPLMAFPDMGHLLDRLIPLASDDPRIALIPHFALMFAWWSMLLFAVAWGLRRVWRVCRRMRPDPLPHSP